MEYHSRYESSADEVRVSAAENKLKIAEQLCAQGSERIEELRRERDSLRRVIRQANPLILELRDRTYQTNSDTDGTIYVRAMEWLAIARQVG